MAKPQDFMDRDYVRQIEKEYRDHRREGVLHNLEMHRRILESWRQYSPRLFARLQRAGVAEQLAYVAQERMWRESRRLRSAGYPVTDARETAEREHLMMEPEGTEESDLD